MGRSRVAGMCLLLVLSALFSALTNALVQQYPALTGGGFGAPSRWKAAWNPPYRVLVVYVFSNTDPGQCRTQLQAHPAATAQHH